jgi:hypothetical protein
VFDGEYVVAGSGPLLLLIGCRLIDVGVHVSAFLDTSMNGALLKALPLLPNALRSHKCLSRGLSLLWKIRKAGIPFYSGIQNIEALGASKLEKVRIGKSGKFFDVTADLLLLHNGVVPNVQITRNLGCEHRWYDVQRYWEPIVDDWGNTSVEHVSIAGDCGRVAGAAISETSGHLAALDTVYQLGIISQTERDKLSRTHRIELAKHQHVRPFLDKLFQPGKKWLIPENDKTLACRCEEVKVSEIRETVHMGIKDPDRLKSMTHSGLTIAHTTTCHRLEAVWIFDSHTNCFSDFTHFYFFTATSKCFVIFRYQPFLTRLKEFIQKWTDMIMPGQFNTVRQRKLVSLGL